MLCAVNASCQRNIHCMGMGLWMARGMFEDDSFYTQRLLSSDDSMSIVVDRLPLFRGPVDQHSFANDILNRQELPLVRVAGVIAVIAKHEQLFLRYDPITVISRWAGNIRFCQGGAIYRDDP